MFIPDPVSEFFHHGSRVKKIPDPHPRTKLSEIWSGITDLDFLPIPDPGVKKAPNPGSRICNTTHCICDTKISRAYAAFLSGGGTRGWKSSGVGVVVGVELGVEEEHPLGVSVSASSPIGE
jgi:hypothetical protein